jgi:hypothetical protein
MNRSIGNVLFGGIAPAAETEHKIEGQITKTNIDETVEALENAENVIIVSILVSSALIFQRLTINVGRWIRNGCRESSICHIGYHENAEE